MGSEIVTREAVISTGQYFPEDISEGLEYFIAIMYVFCSIFMVVLLVTHCRKMYIHNELCGNKEIDINNKEINKWRIHSWYVWIMWYTLFSLICLAVFQISSLIKNIRTGFCYPETFTLFNAWLCGRIAAHVVFVLRVYFMYETTPFGWSSHQSIIAAVLIHVFGIITINLFWGYSYDIEWHESENETAPRYCLGGLKFINIYVAIYEFFMFIYLGILFYVPLKKLLDLKPSDQRNEKLDKQINQLKSYAVRTTVLYIGSASVTIAFVIVIWSTNIMWLGCLDTIVTAMSLVLMTSYYPGLYHKWCCLCIKLFDPTAKSLGSDRGDADYKYVMISVNVFRDLINEIAKDEDVKDEIDVVDSNVEQQALLQ